MPLYIIVFCFHFSERDVNLSHPGMPNSSDQDVPPRHPANTTLVSSQWCEMLSMEKDVTSTLSSLLLLSSQIALTTLHSMYYCWIPPTSDVSHVCTYYLRRQNLIIISRLVHMRCQKRTYALFWTWMSDYFTTLFVEIAV